MTVDLRSHDPLGREAILLTSDTENPIHKWWFDPTTLQLLAMNDSWTVVTAGITPTTESVIPDPAFVPVSKERNS
ncbi:MAG TPA: hypothetical protein VLA82_09170 [Actinomycetota bacterium]|nr:hypothetical protein [Actinomycetota bacterium]